MDKKYDVYGLGNALVDFSVEVDDAVVQELNLTKGQFNLATEEQSKAILERIKYAQTKISPGGSAANCVATIGLLGGKAIHASKVGDDEYGTFYETETRAAGVEPRFLKGTDMTGHCIVLITPDAERTFAVNYGASIQLTKEEIREEDIIASKIMHVDGYKLEHTSTKGAVLHAMAIAKRVDTKVSLDVSDPGVVTRNKEEFLNVIKEFVDIVFCKRS